VAHLEAAVAARLGQSHDVVAAITARTVVKPGRVTHLWLDLRTGRERATVFAMPGGTPIAATLTVTATDHRSRGIEDVQVTHVDYSDHSWLRGTLHWPAKQVISNSIVDPFLQSPILHYRLIGTQMIDGQKAFHLRQYQPTSRSAHTPRDLATVVDFWIATSNDRLIREQRSQDGAVTSTLFVSWLSRTDKTLAHVALAVPAGYQRGIIRTG
jgi:hypothetical protein